jgi:hypothetical protein
MANTRFSGPVISDNGFVGAFTGGTTNLTLSGNLSVAGAAQLNGGLTMDTDKFTVANTTGNTAIGGTLQVTGNTTLSGTANVIIVPTVDPAVAGALWNDAGTLKVSAGA